MLYIKDNGSQNFDFDFSNMNFEEIMKKIMNLFN